LFSALRGFLGGPLSGGLRVVDEVSQAPSLLTGDAALREQREHGAIRLARRSILGVALERIETIEQDRTDRARVTNRRLEPVEQPPHVIRVPPGERCPADAKGAIEPSVDRGHRIIALGSLRFAPSTLVASARMQASPATRVRGGIVSGDL